VYLYAVAVDRRPASGRSQNQAVTDDDGNFKFTGLAPRVYSVTTTTAKGYVQRSVPFAERQDGGFHRVGDNVTITMIKGGVITGRVTNAAGEPLIAVQVNAAMARDAEGNPVRGGARSRFTDDRGVYRIYGLPPGTYVVYTRNGFSGPSPSPYDQDSPTYHPSSTRETATEVTVASGSEVSGVDIRYRGDQGRVISGVVTGAESSSPYAGLFVSLTSASGPVYLGSSAVVRRDDGTSGFSIYGVTDGEYEIVARRNLSSEEFLSSTPRRITVKGADVGGIELKLMPLGSISGRFALQSAPNACDSKRKLLFEEAVLALRSEAKPADSVSAPRPPVFNGLNEKGEFTVYNLEANRYFLEPRLPNENWYVKSITGSDLPPASARGSAARNSAPADVAQSGIALKSGDKISGVTVTISDGAASVSGKVAPAKEGSRLPSRLRLHLVPAEANAANDVLRYAETLARSDGSFSMRNISPGKYWLVARAAPDDEPSDAPSPPVAWDSIERAKLRKEAEATKAEITLKPCQRVTDQIVKQ
jgi:hypothetical protein